MNSRGLVGAALLVAVGVAISTCGQSVEPPTPGWVNVRLATPNADDGGIIFTVAGEGIDSVRTSFANTFVRQEGTSWRVLIAGTLSAGVIGQIHVPDTKSVTGYSGTVLEVAARGTFEQRDVAGYSVTVEAPPAP